jgi:hypothetical protein
VPPGDSPFAVKYIIIIKNFKEGLLDHEDKGTTNLRNIRN